MPFAVTYDALGTSRYARFRSGSCLLHKVGRVDQPGIGIGASQDRSLLVC
jgi:hypothetical protein